MPCYLDNFYCGKLDFKCHINSSFLRARLTMFLCFFKFSCTLFFLLSTPPSVCLDCTGTSFRSPTRIARPNGEPRSSLAPIGSRVCLLNQGGRQSSRIGQAQAQAARSQCPRWRERSVDCPSSTRRRPVVAVAVAVATGPKCLPWFGSCGA